MRYLGFPGCLTAMTSRSVSDSWHFLSVSRAGSAGRTNASRAEWAIGSLQATRPPCTSAHRLDTMSRGPPRRPGRSGGTCAAGNAPARRGPARGTSGGSRAPGTPAGGSAPPPARAWHQPARPPRSVRDSHARARVLAPHPRQAAGSSSVRARTRISSPSSVASSRSK